MASSTSAEEPAHFNSYRELLFDDNQQVLAGGALVDGFVQATDDAGNLLFETDDNGDPVLDVNGNLIPVLEPVTLTAPLSVAGANASPGFFERFVPGGSHAGRLSDAELKLISEWIDIGGQYFNNPFDVPQ